MLHLAATSQPRPIGGPWSAKRARGLVRLHAESQLASLRGMSTIVADTGDLEAVKQWQPVDCTTNPSLVLKAVDLPQYSHLLPEALQECQEAGEIDDGALRPYACVVDRMIINLGREVLKIIPGRVSTECDAHLSYDTQATLEKARHLIQLYESAGVPRDRIYIKIASTWEGIEACRQLEAEGIACNMTLLFSFAQGVAAANARATLVSPFVGRVLDWFKEHEGGEYEGESDPGVQAVTRLYRYYKAYGCDTIVMAASFRNRGEIVALAGCDNITISPALLEELDGCDDPLPRVLSPDMGGCEDEELAQLGEDRFREMHAADAMATDKLREGIEGFAADQRTLEHQIAELAAAAKE